MGEGIASCFTEGRTPCAVFPFSRFWVFVLPFSGFCGFVFLLLRFRVSSFSFTRFRASARRRACCGNDEVSKGALLGVV